MYLIAAKECVSEQAQELRSHCRLLQNVLPFARCLPTLAVSRVRLDCTFSLWYFTWRGDWKRSIRHRNRSLSWAASPWFAIANAWDDHPPHAGAPGIH